MSTYAIGDLQGCFASLQRLLDKIHFDSAHDRLWFVGDLVNRGPDSLATIRFVKNLGPLATTVLGNHDLHLLMLAEGYTHARRLDTLDELLAAPDRDELLFWLRNRHLLYVEGDFVLVHAGLLPGWSVSKALDLAREVEVVLRSENYRELLAHMYGNTPNEWNESLKGYERYRVIINALTRMRLCTARGEMEFTYTGNPEEAPHPYLPWYAVPNRLSASSTLICGHWSALGLRLEANLMALDTGCLWGDHLTAVRVDDREIFQVQCQPLVHLAR